MVLELGVNARAVCGDVHILHEGRWWHEYTFKVFFPEIYKKIEQEANA